MGYTVKCSFPDKIFYAFILIFGFLWGKVAMEEGWQIQRDGEMGNVDKRL